MITNSNDLTSRPDVVAKEKDRVQTLTEKMAKLKSHKEKIKALTA